MSSLLVFIVEFLASIAAAAKARQQARAAEELPQGEKAVAAIDADVAAIRAELAETHRAADAAVGTDEA